MIKIKNLYFSYTGTKPYNLENLTIDLPKGKFVSIVGENGTSKTTLLKLILGYMKPQQGIIEKNCTRIGYVPQKVDNFNSQFSITVEEILLCHLKAIKLNDKNEIDNVLNLVSMKDYKKRLIGSLSGGQQQRIFIARALLGSPDLLILDELSTGVDEKTQNEIYSLISNLTKDTNLTVISVEHNREKAIKYSDLILELRIDSYKLFNKNEYLEYYDKKLRGAN
ncbi:MAG: metal ABC transporter ATP-binding protein [Sarcina sp.]